MFLTDFRFSLLKIIVWGTGFIISGVSIASLIKTVIEIILSRRVGMVANMISIFGYTFARDRDTGKYTKYMDKLKLLSSCQIIYDINKPFMGDKVDDERKVLWNSTFISSSILLVLAVPCYILAYAMDTDGLIGILTALLKGFGLGFAFQAIVSVVITLYVLNKQKSELSRAIQRSKKAILSGMPFNMLSMKPVEEMEGKYSFAEELTYNIFYCYYLLSVENFGELKRVTERMRTLLKDREPLIHYTLAYYWLIYYYSRYEINPMYANKFYEACNQTIIRDQDANAKRVQAYYFYAIRQDVQSARRFVNEGLAVVDKFSVGDEREMERKSLLWLDAFLRDRGF